MPKKTGGHTPGPWKILRSRQKAGYQVASSTDGLVAECWQGSSLRGDTKANARLIAAAPELLEALKNLNAWIGIRLGEEYDGDSIATQVHAAIAKAEGRE